MLNNHNFHLVSVSPWPLLLSLDLLNVGLGVAFWLLGGSVGEIFFFFFFLILILYQWWRDVIRESAYEGCHTFSVSSGLSLGVVCFIVSELFFFVSFFWSYFYFSLSPDIFLGLSWPPVGFDSVNYLDIPFLNTLILLSSGFFITWAHYGFFVGDRVCFNISYLFSIFMGMYFLFIQGYEYYNLGFDFSDGCFGSVFYILTGFHGFHVFVGLVFLLINYFRFFFHGFSFLNFFGFDYSIWYWHFVDLVWLFLYLFIYWWGM